VQNSSQKRKELYQNLLWEHRELTNAHKWLLVSFNKANGNVDIFVSPCCIYILILYADIPFWFTSSADKQDQAQVAELVERIISLEGKPLLLCPLAIFNQISCCSKLSSGVGDKKKIDDKLSELKDQQDAELKVEKDEVVRLKVEIEHLKQQHEIEITGLTKSCKEEVAKFELEKSIAVNETIAKFEKEVARLNTINDTLCQINELQKEQVDLLNGKIKDWAAWAGQLNEDMAGMPLTCLL
jgi:hypothetical protein